MGLMNSKSTNNDNGVNRRHFKNSNRLSSIPRPQPLLSSCRHKNDDNNSRHFYNKRRLCLKKKVLILGLDGVGKTDLFNRLICYDKKESKTDSLHQPTIGYNVETIKLRCHHLCHRKYHNITLWDCGGQLSVRSLWPYHYSNTSLLLWVINIHDRSRLDASLHLLSQILTDPLLYRVPVLIILYNSFDQDKQDNSDEDRKQNMLTNLEVAFRFLATLSTSRASTFKWQVINVTVTGNDAEINLKKIRQCFLEHMEL